MSCYCFTGCIFVGCQVPTDKTTENENGVNSPDIDKEVMSLNDAIDEKEKWGKK